ncbi:MAG: hypothetical protein J3R72DRAFT_429169 [Linnemannia gamsii]|nr:MAG: hypothetical protein J3R72DRAFT_429169 [Linnemannia gamsii]
MHADNTLFYFSVSNQLDSPQRTQRHYFFFFSPSLSLAHRRQSRSKEKNRTKKTMGQIQLRQIRKWMVFITTLNLIGMLAWFGYFGYMIEDRKSRGYYSRSNTWRLLWSHWAIIISAIGFFFAYIFALRGTTTIAIHKYLRAFLFLVPVGVVLYITCSTINTVLEFTSKSYGRGASPFLCYPEDYACYLFNTNLFMSLITALFVVIEVGMTLAWGPLEKKHQFGAHGYAQNANVIIVSPDQPYQQQQQQQPLYYLPHQQQSQQQPLYPQIHEVQQRQSGLPPQQAILVGPNVVPQSADSQQQQQYQQQAPEASPLPYLPYSPSTHAQSPVAATATSGFQPSPEPSPRPSSANQSSPYTPAH